MIEVFEAFSLNILKIHQKTKGHVQLFKVTLPGIKTACPPGKIMSTSFTYVKTVYKKKKKGFCGRPSLHLVASGLGKSRFAVWQTG